jgi:F0F1-type ATP synthase membrane subunit b/b'
VSTGLIIVIGIAAVLIAVVWFFFMAPLEKQMHERQMEMIQKKLEKRRQQAAERGDEDGE